MMGEIAEMHVEAYAAGLDPNEMDGADWAEFYDDDRRMTHDEVVDSFGVDARVFLAGVDDLQDQDELDVSVSGRAAVLRQYLPNFCEQDAQELMRLMVNLSDAANAEGDRLRDEQEATQ